MNKVWILTYESIVLPDGCEIFEGVYFREPTEMELSIIFGDSLADEFRRENILQAAKILKEDGMFFDELAGTGWKLTVHTDSVDDVMCLNDPESRSDQMEDKS